MPSRIHVLEEAVANRIAAGEVIERPASVLKELIDNAVDAGAKRIDVESERGGKSLIRVTDDGSGMNRDDALLCLERHATSKIRSADDLDALRTMGFRGEALPSIASVSRFRLLTREPDSIGGTEVIVDGGKLKDVREAGCAPGTMVEVRSLFLHTPGRRKFLRADGTEQAHFEQGLRYAAMARPDIGFRYRKDGQGDVEYPACGSLGDRLRQVFGVRWMEDMASVSQEGRGLKLNGYISRPGISRSTRQEHHLFINGRPVQSQGLNFAILEGYRQVLVRGRFPVLVLFLEIDPAQVDVNVHPAKREVRFRDESGVRRFVADTLAAALRTATSEPAQVSLMPSPTGVPQPRPVQAVLPARQASFFSSEEYVPALAPLPKHEEPGEIKEGEGEKASPPRHSLRICGMLLGHYIVAEGNEGIVLVDQRAAHERILFEEILGRLACEEIASQGLLLPLSLEFPPEEADVLRRHEKLLRQVGFGVAGMGGDTFILDAVPPFLKAQDVEEIFRDLVADLLQTGGRAARGRALDEEALVKVVCRHAVRVSDQLKPSEIDRLLDDLHACELPYTCPVGRPTMIMLGRDELARKFGHSV